MSVAITSARKDNLRPERRAYFKFSVICLLPGVLFLSVLGRKLWFFGDEWDFVHSYVSGRSFIRTILRPHGEHIVVLPSAIFRVMLSAFGLRSYKPYLFVSLSVHMIIAILVGYLVLRFSERLLLAVVSFATMALYGAGSENIFWAFQMGFMLAIAGTLACAILLLDDAFKRHPGLLALAAFVALASHGPGLASSVPLVFAIGKAWKDRESFVKVVLAAGLPLILAATWYLVNRSAAGAKPNLQNGRYAVAIIDAAASSWTAPSVGLVLVVLSVGQFLTRSSASERICGTSLVGCAVVFATLTSFARTSALAEPSASRYVYTATAFLLPVVAAGVAQISPKASLGFLALTLLLNAPTLSSFSRERAKLTWHAGQLLHAHQQLVVKASALPEVSVDATTVDLTDQDLRTMSSTPDLELEPTVDQVILDEAANIVSWKVSAGPAVRGRGHRFLVNVESVFEATPSVTGSCDGWETGPNAGAVEVTFRSPGTVRAQVAGVGVAYQLSASGSPESAHRAQVKTLPAGASVITWALPAGSVTFQLSASSRLSLCDT